jgi:hypothetical protein
LDGKGVASASLALLCEFAFKLLNSGAAVDVLLKMVDHALLPSTAIQYPGDN